MADQQVDLSQIEYGISNALRGIDHTSTSVRKYHFLQTFLKDLLNTPTNDIYCTQVSKAANVSTRLDQSQNSRRASKLVIMASLPANEPALRTLEALRRYLSQRSQSGELGSVAEALVLTPANGDEWQVYAIVIPATEPSAFRDIFSSRSDILVETYVSNPLVRSGSIFGSLTFEVIEAMPQVAEEDSLPSYALDSENLSPNGQGIFPHRNSTTAFLVREPWDDDGLNTSFRVFVQFPTLNDKRLITTGLTREIGSVKIASKGMRSGRTRLPTLPFEMLDDSHYSLGQNYSYYENVKRLPEEAAQVLLTGLRDVVYDSSAKSKFEKEYAFRASLARSGQAARALDDAPALFHRRRGHSMASVNSIKFHAQLGSSVLPATFEFDDSGPLPGRINALIGYNGVGKTQLLANLAVVATSDLEQRRKISSKHGYLTNSEETRFSSVIAISYSAFDTFTLPADLWAGKAAANAAQKAEETGEVVGYAYCGLRKRSGAESSGELKSIDEVTSDFVKAVARARSLEKQVIFKDAWQIIRAEPSFARLGFDTGSRDVMTRENFGQLSAGHKIVLNIVAQVVSRASPGSLILIDEPECHLHPSLLSALIRALSHVLNGLDSHAIIATHSPVVLQEIPGKYVRILQRHGNRPAMLEPDSETFGENVGFLTNNVFHLDSSRTDFHEILGRLALSMSMDEIDDLFEDGMSSQARAYVLSIQKSQVES